MSPHAQEILRRYDQLDRALVSKGFPPTSPWWMKTIGRWYESGKRQLVARVGRRGGKSSTLSRLGVVEALYGNHFVPPGDVGVVAVISTRRSEANERLRTIKAILDAIGVGYTEKGDTVELITRRVAFNVYTATVAGVSGFTAIFILCDEVSKWRDSETGANPAAQVIVSVRPTVATQSEARIVLCSSPMGYLDAHADAFAQGETPLQTTAVATTWEANPTVTKVETEALEPDPLTWAREYAAIPQAETETSVLSEAWLDKLTRSGPQDLEWDSRHRYVATMDPATRGNAWTFVISTLSDNHVRKICLAREWVGTKQKPLVAGQVFKEIKPLLALYKLRHVHSDQFSEDTLREIANQHQVYLLVDTPWTQSTKADAYDGLMTLSREGRLELPPDPVVKTDLLGIRQKLTRTGMLYDLAAQGSRHSDYAPSVAMGVMLCKIPPLALPMVMTLEDEWEKAKNEFLLGREAERKREEKYGRRPVTHRK